MSSINELSTVATLSLESAASVLLFIIAIKLYRAKITSHSGCCGGSLIIDTTNPGVVDEAPAQWKKKKRGGSALEVG